MAELLTSEEAAKRLDMCERTLRKLRASGAIPFVELSERKIRYRAEDCDEYIEAHTKRNNPCPSGSRRRPVSTNLTSSSGGNGFMAQLASRQSAMRNNSRGIAAAKSR